MDLNQLLSLLPSLSGLGGPWAVLIGVGATLLLQRWAKRKTPATPAPQPVQAQAVADYLPTASGPPATKADRIVATAKAAEAARLQAAAEHAGELAKLEAVAPLVPAR